MRKNKNDNRDYIKDINTKIDVLNGLYDYRDVYIAKINIHEVIENYWKNVRECEILLININDKLLLGVNEKDNMDNENKIIESISNLREYLEGNCEKIENVIDQWYGIKIENEEIISSDTYLCHLTHKIMRIYDNTISTLIYTLNFVKNNLNN
tara:strand:+ start:480 stop:938 length:459 start_codon:yes stop_codon:yes gene_type:complete